MDDDLSVRCVDCVHRMPDGGCEAALERLRLEGWPAARVRPRAEAAAAGCPGFEPDADRTALAEEVRSARRGLRRAAAARGHRVLPGPSVP
ncbi:MAG: hypothetical protein AB7D57_12960 [Desulfovibrionaceae bacterium]